MLNRLSSLSRGQLYWIALLLGGLALQATALFYQYVLDEWPCVICIHIRIWIAGFILVAVLALFVRKRLPVLRLLHGLNVIMMLGFAERSYQVLAVERGWVFGGCNLELGMPAWFALDQWMPWLFEVKTSCGYTPLIVGNISMAEILMALSALLCLISFVFLVSSFIKGDSIQPA